MFLIKMIDFCKNSVCPSSQTLLDFQTNSLPAEHVKIVVNHVNSCDFCGAEVELYSRFVEMDETVAEAEIPAPLYELAEFLLNDCHKDRSFLTQLLIEDTGLTLTEA